MIKRTIQGNVSKKCSQQFAALDQTHPNNLVKTGGTEDSEGCLLHKDVTFPDMIIWTNVLLNVL